MIMDVAIFVILDGIKQGKMVSIVEASTVATLSNNEYSYNESISSPRGAVVFVRDFPIRINVKKLTEPWMKANGRGTMGYFENKLDLSVFASRRKLSRKKQVTVDFTEFRSAIYNVKNDRFALDGDME